MFLCPNEVLNQTYHYLRIPRVQHILAANQREQHDHLADMDNANPPSTTAERNPLLNYQAIVCKFTKISFGGLLGYILSAKHHPNCWQSYHAALVCLQLHKNESSDLLATIQDFWNRCRLQNKTDHSLIQQIQYCVLFLSYCIVNKTENIYTCIIKFLRIKIIKRYKFSTKHFLR